MTKVKKLHDCQKALEIILHLRSYRTFELYLFRSEEPTQTGGPDLNWRLSLYIFPLQEKKFVSPMRIVLVVPDFPSSTAAATRVTRAFRAFVSYSAIAFFAAVVALMGSIENHCKNYQWNRELHFDFLFF